VARKKTSRRWIESGPRAAWMERYIQWLVGQPGAELTGSRGEYRSRHPTITVRAAKASYFATRPVQPELVRLLEKRKDVREYFEKVRSDVDFHTKELAKQQVAENFEAREAGLRAASGRTVDPVTGEVSYDVKDIKALEHYTRVFVERGIGKKVEHDKDRSPRIVINLIGASEERKKLWLEDTIDEVDYEIIENPRQITDGEDD
jgi:hypothetical protein